MRGVIVGAMTEDDPLAEVRATAQGVREAKKTLDVALRERERVIRASRYKHPKPTTRQIAAAAGLTQPRISRILADD